MHASFQPKAGIIRIYDQGSFEQKSPYVLSLFLTAVGDTALLEGLASPDFRKEHWRAIADELRACGFAWMEWDRAPKNGMPGRRVRQRLS